MDVPVIVGSRLRYRIHRRLVRLSRHDDGFEVGLWGHPALRVAMTPAGFEFSQIDWYRLTFSYKRRRLLMGNCAQIEPARLLVALASNLFGFVYLSIYLTDWAHMFALGQLPFEAGRLGVDPQRYREPRPAAPARP
jgi:hypothetical protein